MSDLFGNYVPKHPSGEGVTLYNEDCRAAIKKLADNSIDSVVTDPPYALVSITKRFGKDGAAPAKSNGATGVYIRASTGFMGKTWDTGEVAFDPEFWSEILRVLKPGGHVLAFGGTRSYHRLACAIEDAGFEIRDQIGWLYGTGFPKSLDVSKAIDKAAGADEAQQWQGWGTALKPSHEPICLARKPLIGTVAENVLTYGTGGVNIDGCRVHAEDALEGRKRHGGGIKENHTSPAGRHPANIIHDGSDEVIAAFPDSKGQQGNVTGKEPSDLTNNTYGKFNYRMAFTKRNDTGSAARFFYSAKASRADRDEGNTHPTVKPTDLMAYLCRLVTPPGGVVLDPFMGSGSTGKAALREGFRFVGIERESEYFEIAKRRVRRS